MGKDFFSEPQGAAVFKHGVFKRYVPKFAGKLGSKSPGNRVVICDGYAGPGQYEDGTPGSPIIVAETASHMFPQRNVELICVERDVASADHLAKALATFAGVRSVVLTGSFEAHVDEVVEFASDSPLLAFLDPFGMGAPMDKLRGLLSRDPPVGGGYHGGPPTEILMNFSLLGLQRCAGLLTSASNDSVFLKGRATTLKRMDEWLGGDWWQEVYLEAHASGTTDGVLRDIVIGYLKRLAGGRAWHVASASDRWDGSTAYLLALFTASDVGLWEFNSCLSNAREDFYEHTHRNELPFDPPFKQWSEEWVPTIAANIEGELTKGPVRIRGALSKILGTTLGFARETHIRKAIKNLHAEGKTPSDGKGDLFGYVILPAP